MKKWLKWILLALIILIAFVIFLTLSKNSDSFTPLQFIQADWIELDRIGSISKFRSGSGHDFSQGTGETCRSMKHYFNVPFSQEGEKQKTNGMPPAPDGKNDIKIFSPVDGKIIDIESEQTSLGEQIYIKPTNVPSYTVRLFHIYKLDGIEKGTLIKAGQQIGVIGQYQNTDIAIEKKMAAKTNFVSYFEVMPDSIFAKYQARGVKNRSELIITKEYRDAHPLKCDGESFAINYDAEQNSENFVFLTD